MVSSKEVWAELCDELGRYPTEQEVQDRIESMHEAVELRVMPEINHEEVRARAKKFKRAFNRLNNKHDATGAVLK